MFSVINILYGVVWYYWLQFGMVWHDKDWCGNIGYSTEQKGAVMVSMHGMVCYFAVQSIFSSGSSASSIVYSGR